MEGLNARQSKFVDEYIISGNATEAAINAGYSKRTAEVTGSRLLSNDKVSEKIRDRMEELQDEKILTQKQILVMLSEIASGQAKEYKDVVTKKGEFVENPNTGKKQLVYNESSEIIELPTKNSDRNRALELLGKRHAMWTDKIDQTNKNIEITLGEWSDDDED